MQARRYRASLEAHNARHTTGNGGVYGTERTECQRIASRESRNAERDAQEVRPGAPHALTLLRHIARRRSRLPFRFAFVSAAITSATVRASTSPRARWFAGGYRVAAELRVASLSLVH